MSGSLAEQVISITASASYNGNQAPVYELLINGTIEATGTVASNSAIAQTFTVALPPGVAETAVIAFINHESSSQMLDVHSINVNGMTISTSAPGEQYVSSNGTYDRWGQMYFGGEISIPIAASDFVAGSTAPGGSEASASSVSTSSAVGTVTTSGAAAGSGGVAGSTQGASDTTAPSSGAGAGSTVAYTISVQASASFDSGHAPDIALSIDGVRVGTGQFTSSSPQTLTFTAALAPGSAHDIEIDYTNHVDSAEMLSVQDVTINGQTLSTTSAGEEYISANGTYHGWGQMYFGGDIQLPVAASYFPGGTAVGGTSSTSPTGAGASSSTGTSTSTGAGGLTVASGATTTSKAFYVSPSGNDANAGSAIAPFATFHHALAMMEATGVHTLYVDGGSYSLSSPIQLVAADNGDSILAAPGATPVLDAGGATSALLALTSADNVTVSGLTFQNASANPQQAAVTLEGSSNDTLSFDSFLNDGEGLLFASGSSSNLITHSLFGTSQTSAIEVKDGSNNNSITYDEVSGVGALTTHGGAVYAHGASGLTVANNLIENTAGSGITLSDFAPGMTTLSNAVIKDNVLVNIGTDAASSDYGAIYDLGRTGNDQNTLIEDNYVSGVGTGNPSAHAEVIYLDDLASGVTVSGNVVAGLNGASDAMEIHGGQSLQVTGNVFDLQGQGRAAIYFAAPPNDYPGTGVPFTGTHVNGNIILTQQSAPLGAFADFDATASGGPLLTAIVGNDYWRSIDPGSYPMGNLADRSPTFVNPQLAASPSDGPLVSNYISGSDISAASPVPVLPGLGLDGMAVGAS